MTYSNSLADDLRPLVLDTSVLINLYACSYGERILAAIPNGIIVPQVVAAELEHETSRNKGEHGFLHGLIAGGKVTLGEMSDQENALFANLTSGSPSLDDGEAATIAIGAKRQFLPLIDDRKGRAQAIQVLCGRKPGWSIDLFCHASVTSALGNTAAIEALYLALLNGRMRVPVESTEHIINLLGSERARDCTCLPGYRKLFGQPMNRHSVEKQEEHQKIDGSKSGTGPGEGRSI